MTATIVVVRGAWSGRWIWQPLGHELGQRRLARRAVDLPSVGEDAGGWMFETTPTR